GWISLSNSPHRRIARAWILSAILRRMTISHVAVYLEVEGLGDLPDHLDMTILVFPKPGYSAPTIDDYAQALDPMPLYGSSWRMTLRRIGNGRHVGVIELRHRE